jgi:hypothetical protein
MLPPIPAPQTTIIAPEPPATTLTYEQSAQLMADPVFRGRVKVACLEYATSIQNEATDTPAHTSRLRWAQNCYLQPDMTAAQMQAPTVMDPAVQQAGSEIEDSQLQGAVEAVINKVL